ncbi:hypothetical protein GCM10010249_30810 [Streptomyces roseolilacinus]|uniref:Uncharacterized protein n=1 Tax=Streptomyces roseolilacinus TaxID=66904 RepID=A0A918B0Y1_9ACTN|nr:hypothetical protein GCM10010249_30810 [Streptomyces roseolilacinus]
MTNYFGFAGSGPVGSGGSLPVSGGRCPAARRTGRRAFSGPPPGRAGRAGPGRIGPSGKGTGPGGSAGSGAPIVRGRVSRVPAGPTGPNRKGRDRDGVGGFAATGQRAVTGRTGPPGREGRRVAPRRARTASRTRR